MNLRGLIIQAARVAPATLGLAAALGACSSADPRFPTFLSSTFAAEGYSARPFAPPVAERAPPIIHRRDPISETPRSAPSAESRPFERAESKARVDDAVFDAMARDLLATLEPGLKIALQPYRAGDVPIPQARAQSFNDALGRAIESASSIPGTIVAREELPRLFAEAEEFGDSTATQKLLEAAKADVLVIGTLVPVQGGVEISYKAFDALNGRQLASAAPRFHAVDASAPSGMSLDQALAAAAEGLVKQAPDMKSVETLGVYYQQSDVQTALGSYIGRELVGRLVEKVGGLEAMPAALLRPQQMDKLAAGGAEAAMVDGRPGAYLLSGTIWDFGADVEVRMSLRGKDNRVASYGVRIRRDAIPASLLPLAPRETPVVRREPIGPFGLQLTSDRGRRPVYSIGDSARLIVQSTREGYLYCFHQASLEAGGGITTIFPNAYHRDARVAGQASVHIPDNHMKFALRVSGPPGVEYVRCFALDRDLGNTLARWSRGGELETLSLRSLDEVGRIIRTVPSAAVTEANLVMTIDRARE